MAHYTEGSRELIDATVAAWSERCLLGDGSLLFEVRDGVWAAESSDEPLRAAEALLVHLLFTGSVTPAGKRRLVAEALARAGAELPEDAEPVRALEQWIGHPGAGFTAARDDQLAYLDGFVARLKALSADERHTVLGDPWRLRDLADDTHEAIPEMRHVVLHLLHPGSFERIVSGGRKRELAQAFEGLLGDDAPDDADERLLAIRGRLEELMPDGTTPTAELDFHHEPLSGVWESDGLRESEGAGDLEALEWKKQIVLYGPPGTSKSFQARRLAETLIRRTAMRLWGAEDFLAHRRELERAVLRNVFWVQLHAGYGYEEFIRGMRLEGETTVYRRGLLPHIVRHAGGQSLTGDLPRLPTVLVLDEMNRTDLSRMLGEAFSLLEADQRGKIVELPGVNPGEPPESFAIPPDLYIIGTMNEIDQSVEQLDFALRRRFLWRECPFDPDTLLAIVRQRWARDVPERFPLAGAAEQLERFAGRAEALNAAIADSAELGRSYEVGHTYFAEIPFFLGTWLQGHQEPPADGAYLWTASGRAQPPLHDLWDRSLAPLLRQYLAGSESPDDELAVLQRAYLGA